MTEDERHRIIERIERLSIPEPNTGCWLWLGQMHKSRKFYYGRIEIKGRRWRAHRAIVKAVRGRLRSDYVVRHMCDTPLCVNPSHLRPGTQRQNVRDQERYK